VHVLGRQAHRGHVRAHEHVHLLVNLSLLLLLPQNYSRLD
jgi:hypothetical protein